MQTNPDALRGRGFFKLVTDEGIASLYRGWGWTMARNAPGSFALFGGSAATKEYLFKLTDYSQATWGQSEPNSPSCGGFVEGERKRMLMGTDFVASIGGAVASITVAAPLDVVKTRIQNANFNSTVGGGAIIKEMIKTEGVGAFFKGLTPKVSTLSAVLGQRFGTHSSLNFRFWSLDPS